MSHNDKSDKVTDECFLIQKCSLQYPEGHIKKDWYYKEVLI